MKQHWPRIALLSAIAVSFGVSFFSENIDDYVVNILIMIGINVILAVSLNLVNGHTGQFSLGHAGFMAVGAYAATAVTLFTRLTGWLPGPVVFILALLAAGLAAALCGLLVGIPSLRLRGDYLAIVTLGFGEIIRVVIQNTEILGGPRGLSGIPQYTNFFWVFALASVTIYVIGCLVESTYGRGFLAVRDDEVAAEAMGINTTKYKVTAFVLGSFFAGIAGGLYAHYFQYITPEGFNFLKSVEIVIMVILGGMGSTIGVAVAAIGLTVLNEFLREAEQYRMIIFALALIIIMILRPQGLIGDIGWLRRGRRKQS
ncbi:MAG: branched-chain amino acid ABC transporter permease [Verrucomicrobiaceae bacterium]|nr:MAG: branched-chain amino acid ABC transporter permease [Verrucomicrobiaceae bacterium]